MNQLKNEGKMFIFTAPSGAGKTTIVHHLLKHYDFLDFSVSATTRKRRKHEVDGKDYYFLPREEFDKRIEADEFIEWEEVYEDRYGTLKNEVERVWESNKHIVFDIEVKGATNIKNLYGDRCKAIFIKPPSVEVLIGRLKNRNTESAASLKKRIARVKREMTYQDTFDAILVNDLLDVALKEAEFFVETFIYGKPFDEEE